jgi:hypothetical protein
MARKVYDIGSDLLFGWKLAVMLVRGTVLYHSGRVCNDRTVCARQDSWPIALLLDDA